MKLKVRPGDFRVRELLRKDYLTPDGEHRVYRVTKRKLTSPEAARALAHAAGVEVGDVSMAGLKDRQGITVQHMSVPGGASVAIEDPELRIDYVGTAQQPLSSADSEGNAFEINVRDLARHELDRLRGNLEAVRRVGVPNYFDEQRFGNLTHGQGWVAKELMLDRPEAALRALLCGRGAYENPNELRFKEALEGAWGDFDKCLAIATKRGTHRSIFQCLVDRPGDFRGAFRYVASRLRLIHLYAFQSHLWNRAVAELVREGLPVDDRLLVESIEGPLVCHAAKLPEGSQLEQSFPLPGIGLEDVTDPRARNLLSDALAREGLAEGQFEVRGVEGFALKGEPRPLFCVPKHLRVRPSEDDREHPGQAMVRLRFELPRGAYATLVVKRLLAAPVGEEQELRPPAHGDTRRRAEHERGPRAGHGHDRGRAWERGHQAGGHHGGRQPGGWDDRRHAGQGQGPHRSRGTREDRGPRGGGRPQQAWGGERSFDGGGPRREGDRSYDRGRSERGGWGHGGGGQGQRGYGGDRGSDRSGHQHRGQHQGGDRRGERGRSDYGGERRQERGYQGRGDQDRGYQDRGHQGRGYQGRGYQDRGDQERGQRERGYQQRGYQDRGYQDRGHQERGHQERGHQERGGYRRDERGGPHEGGERRYERGARSYGGEHRQGGGGPPFGGGSRPERGYRQHGGERRDDRGGRYEGGGRRYDRGGPARGDRRDERGGFDGGGFDGGGRGFQRGHGSGRSFDEPGDAGRERGERPIPSRKPRAKGDGGKRWGKSKGS